MGLSARRLGVRVRGQGFPQASRLQQMGKSTKNVRNGVSENWGDPEE